MKALNKSTFKEWQLLPLPSRSPREESEAGHLPKCRAAESAGPSCAKPERNECRPRQTGAAEAAGNRSQPIPALQAFQRP